MDRKPEQLLPDAPSVAGRAALAVALMLGFYLLALAVIAALLLVPYAIYQARGSVPGRLAAACIIGAGVVLVSILPRRDRFVAPGPTLDPRRYPELFQEIAEVARATGQQMPGHVYLAPDVNAGVAKVGGIMGFGGKQIMIVGLPLLAVLTLDQFRAVLAHEFGHHYGGDTKLGPWVYRTREAIERTLRALGESGRQILHFLFRLYGTMFLRLTLAVSRRQEYAADALAARIVGPEPMKEGLTTIHRAALAFDPYLRQEFEPLVAGGHRPPLVEGFLRFLRAGRVAEALEEATETELREGRAEAFDSHPSLRERLAALGSLGTGDGGPDGRPALSLLPDYPDLEPGFLSVEGHPPAPMAWEDAGSVWLSIWADEDPIAEPVGQLTVGSLAELPSRIDSLANQTVQGMDDADPELAREVKSALTVHMIGQSLALALHRRGWELLAEPGEEMVMRKGDASVEPFLVVQQLASGELPAEGWREACRQAGIEDLTLAEAASPAVG